jgi:hypothetical protein
VAEYEFVDAESSRRAQRWVSSIGCYALDDETLAVLSHCTDKAEVSFAAHFLTVPGWYCVDARVFQSAYYQLVPGAQLGDDRVSFLLHSRAAPKERSAAIDIDTDTIVFRGAEKDARGERLRTHAKLYLHFDSLGGMIWGPELRDLLKEEFRVGSRTADRLSPWHKGPLMARVVPGQFDWSTLSYDARLARTRGYLGLKKVELPEHLIQVLANCETSAEMEFALPILKAMDWKVPNRRTITDGVNEVHFQQKVRNDRVDFLIGRLASKNEPHYAIDVNNPVTSHRNYAAELTSEKAARDAGLRYERITHLEAFGRGQIWARLLKEAREERAVRNREVRRTFDPNRDGPPEVRP